MLLRRLIQALTGSAAFLVTGDGGAQTLDGEAALIRSLDRAFKPGFFGTSAGRRNADGTYAREVTTGDAIAKPTFGKPLETAHTACSEAGGALNLAVTAGRYVGRAPQATVDLGGERYQVDYATLYRVFSGQDGSVFKADSFVFRPMFRTSPFADRAASQADS